MVLTAGQVSNYKGAATCPPELPAAKKLLADRRYDANGFRKTLLEKGIHPTQEKSQDTDTLRQIPIHTASPY